MLPGFVKRSYGSAVMLATLPGQRRIPYLPREKLLRRRDARFRRLLRFAVATVPYYHDLFSERNLLVEDFRGCEDLARLPLVDRELVRCDPGRFTSTSRRGRSSIPFATSGSTGEPLRVFLDRRSLLARAAYNARERAVIRHFIDREFRYKELTIGYSGNSIARLWEFYEKAAFLPVRTNSLTLSINTPFDTIVREINRFKPDLLASYGSFIEFFFRKVSLERISIHRPKLIRYGADTLSEEGREMLERQFGIPVISHYGCVECFNMGFSCEKRRGFHVHEDLCHLRFVNESGEEVKPGQMGQVVVSNLANYGTVLLNYKTGDLASLATASCPCGRTFGMISNLAGRVEEMIKLKGGGVLHPRAVWEVLKGEAELLRYQLVQIKPDRYQLKLVISNPTTFAAVRLRIQDELAKLFGDRDSVEIVSCDSIPPSASGKHSGVKPVRSGRFENDT